MIDLAVNLVFQLLQMLLVVGLAPLLTGPVHLLYLLEEIAIDERTFFD